MSLAAGTDDCHEIAASLRSMQLIDDGEEFSLVRLAGGVSCDVFRVDFASRPSLVVKRALARLRVAAEWNAPPERMRAEVAWLKLIAGINPDWVPRILGEDRARHLFAMAYFPPADYPLWKAELAAGRSDIAFAATVGDALARMHAATAGNATIAAAFANDEQFRALRLEPYLLYTAERHPDLAPVIRATVNQIAAARVALMQGDISPKNILCGPKGPIFLDAETACYGDPAFDLAFCLNHFLLKRVWHPQWREGYAQAFAALSTRYLAIINWEEPGELDRRSARLLPMLFLARVDGKSPVEYLTTEQQKSFVRSEARAMIAQPPANLTELARRYFAGSK